MKKLKLTDTAWILRVKDMRTIREYAEKRCIPTVKSKGQIYVSERILAAILKVEDFTVKIPHPQRS